MSQSSAVTARRLLANRRNAKKSTGPRAPQGKARASRNASTHGVFCRELVLPGEDSRLLLALRSAMLLRLNPQDVLELLLVDRVVSAMWRLRRIQAAASAAHDAQSERMLEFHARQLDKIERKLQQDHDDAEHYDDEEKRAWIERHEKELLDLKRQRERQPSAAPAEFTLLAMLKPDDGRRASTLETLGLYERRLEQTLHRSCAG